VAGADLAWDIPAGSQYGYNHAAWTSAFSTGDATGRTAAWNAVCNTVTGKIGEQTVTWKHNLGKPLHQIFSGAFVASTLGQSAWSKLGGGAYAVQPHCNREGFNVNIPGWVTARFGIGMNQENECKSPDTLIGFGLNRGSTASNAGGSCGCCNTGGQCAAFSPKAQLYVADCVNQVAAQVTAPALPWAGARFRWDASTTTTGPLPNLGTAGATYSLSATGVTSGNALNGLPTRRIMNSVANGMSVSLVGATIQKPHVFMVYVPQENLWGSSKIIFRDQSNGYNFGQYRQSSDVFDCSATSGAINGQLPGGGVAGTAYIVEAFLPPSGIATALLSVTGGIGGGVDKYVTFKRETDAVNVLTTINVAGTMYEPSHSSSIDLAELLIFDGSDPNYAFDLTAGSAYHANRKQVIDYLRRKWIPTI